MKFANLILALLLTLISFNSYSAEVTTDNVKVDSISVWSKNGSVLVQTSPRHTLPAGCTNDFWLVLDKNDLGYQATLSMLLSAQAQNKPITVVASDSFATSNGFCGLTRVILNNN